VILTDSELFCAAFLYRNVPNSVHCIQLLNQGVGLGLRVSAVNFYYEAYYCMYMCICLSVRAITENKKLHYRREHSASKFGTN